MEAINELRVELKRRQEAVLGSVTMHSERLEADVEATLQYREDGTVGVHIMNQLSTVP